MVKIDRIRLGGKRDSRASCGGGNSGFEGTFVGAEAREEGEEKTNKVLDNSEQKAKYCQRCEVGHVPSFFQSGAGHV
jgi:hypothetical protein